MENTALKKYKMIAIIGILMAIFGMVSVTFLPTAFPVKKFEPFFGTTFTYPNIFFSYLGIVMVIGGGIISFYGRYKYTKEEEKEDIERMKKGL